MGLADTFLDLGEMPLANSYVEPGNSGRRENIFKLAVAYCPQCHLVQITHRVHPRELFSNYLYFSSFSSAFLSHAEEMAESLTARFALNPTSLIMEIGSNDGYLLQFFTKNGIPVLGIEPAKNIAEIANDNGIRTMEVFFGSESVTKILEHGGKADVIIGNNVLAHVPLVNDFLISVYRCLKPGGCAVFEFPYLKDLLDNTEFDTIYHEHVFYYSLSAISILAERAGLELYDASRQNIHGGSLRVFLQKERHYDVSSTIKEMLEQEHKCGMTSSTLYSDFGDRVRKLKSELVRVLNGLRKEGKTIAAYGAAAKGSTLLNYAGIDRNTIDFVVDRSTYKQGLLMPGTGIPILHQDELQKRMPDYTLILAWNFADEIVMQQSGYLEKGGRFIIPIPTVQVI